MVSEEEDHPVEVDLDKQGKYVVTFDPLDGSSNIDANVSIGSVFGIWRRVTEKGEKPTTADYLRSGREMVAAGYCIYGSATQFVLCCGGTVDGYTLDTSLGEFLLTHPDIKIPQRGKIYSCNEGYT
jgi:fructose-1,6-bisphosphatase I